jgi:hypothetical protein
MTVRRKKLIEKNLSYDEVKRLTVKLVQHASPQTQLLEADRRCWR